MDPGTVESDQMEMVMKSIGFNGGREEKIDIFINQVQTQFRNQNKKDIVRAEELERSFMIENGFKLMACKQECNSFGTPIQMKQQSEVEKKAIENKMNDDKIQTWYFNSHPEPMIFKVWKPFPGGTQIDIEVLYLFEDKRIHDVSEYTINFDEMTVIQKSEKNGQKR